MYDLKTASGIDIVDRRIWQSAITITSPSIRKSLSARKKLRKSWHSAKVRRIRLRGCWQAVNNDRTTERPLLVEPYRLMRQENKAIVDRDV